MTKILDLPVDLMEEIISRTPKKFTRAVRSTCKKWDTLWKSQSFTKMQISKVTAMAREGELLKIISMDYNLYLQSIVFKGIDVDPFVKPIGKLTCLNDSEQVKISRVFYCEGLLLCILKDILKIVVWNPYLGQTRWIKPRYFHHARSRQYMDRCGYGFGYENKKNKSCPNHKILRFTNHVYPTGNIIRGKDFFWYEIYDFDSGLWTTLDITPQLLIWCGGVSLKGNTYFFAKEREPEDEYFIFHHIICFDFTSERFGPLLRLPFSANDSEDYVNLSCVREEKLVVLLTHNEVNPFESEVWITTKIEAENVSWSKFLTLNTEPNYCPLSPTNFFIDEEKKVIMSFDECGDGFEHHVLSIVGENGYFKQLILRERADVHSRFHTNTWPYVPSLVQIKQNAGSKRKRQSSLEKRRFDQKKARFVALENPNYGRYELRSHEEDNLNEI